jgi:hypothetical protein
LNRRRFLTVAPLTTLALGAGTVARPGARKFVAGGAVITLPEGWSAETIFENGKAMIQAVDKSTGYRVRMDSIQIG